MKEFNKKTLIEALSSMPEYEPPEVLWAAIESQFHATEGNLSPAMLKSLPVHEPPASVWDTIDRELNTGKNRLRQLQRHWKPALGIAASLALIAFVLFLVPKNSPVPVEYSMQYGTEQVDEFTLKQDWNEDEEAFRSFIEICQAKKFICEQPAFKQLQSELEELTEAKEALLSSIGDFSVDARLVAQIKAIEIERTAVLKKLMIMLI